MTLPLIHAYAEASQAERTQIGQIVEGEQLSNADLEQVCALIDRYNGIEYTRQRAADRIELAKARLNIFPAGEVRDALFALADYVVARNK